MKSILTVLAGVAVSVSSFAASAQEIRVQGGGASFPKALYLRWASDYSKASEGKVQVEYNSKGSGFGIAGVTNKTLDFAGSDAPMNRKEREAAKEANGGIEIVHIPACAGAVVMAFNLPGYDGEVKLTGEIIADVYLGRISKWNDDRIKAENPEAKLPDLAITPVCRADGSGTSFVFSSYLGTQSQDFLKQIPPTKQFPMKVGAAETGNEGVSNAVRKIPGAFGYIELTYALNEKLQYALVKNKAGKYIKASTQSVSKAGEQAENLVSPIWNSAAEDAYPISSFTYLLVYKDLGGMPREKAERVKDFLKYSLTTGQSAAEELYYAPLPEAVRKKALEAIEGLTWKGEAIKASSQATR